MLITKETNKPLPPLSAALERIKSQLLQLPENEIPQVVHDISEWKYPRGDFFQWIGVLNRFDGILHRVCEDHGLDKGIQTTPFSENTRAVLIAIFQFTRYLMENCINRNLYNSLTELRACLYTTHLDVLASALYVVVRIAQRVTVHHHRVSRDSLTMFAEPIAALSQWWGHDAISVPLVDLAQANGHIPSSVGDLKFNFYRVPSTSTTESSEPSNSTGLVSIDLPHAEVSQPGDVITLFHQLAERYQVPKEHRLSLLHRFLVSRYVREPDVRQQLLYCRLLGVSLEIMSQNELALENGLFRLEPNLAEELAAILHPERSVPVNLCAASMYALEALVRQRSRSQDVSTALNVSVSHGLLIIMLRRIFSDVYPPHEGQTHAFIDALTMLLAALSAIPAGGQLVVSAGMVTQLIGFLSHHQPWHKRTLGKLVRLLDNLIYTQSTAFDSFCNANGVTTLVERIGAEVQEVLAIDAEKRSGDSQAMVVEGSTPSGAHPDEPSEPSPASPIASFEDIPTETSALLKDLVRILHHMLQTTGNSDRLRNLVETALPKTMRHIVRYPELFGYSIYVYTINIMATMVHNEPTCLAILQELDLPDVFLTGVTRKILVSSDVLFSLPNAFGAICLNQTGLERFLESGALEKYIRVLTDKEYIRPLLDLEVLPAMASSLDELARHHPRLQQPILTCVQQVITSPVFRATPGELLDVDRPTKCTMCSPADLPATKEQWKSADDMLMAQRYDILFRFLEVFLQVRRHRHDMFKQLDPSYLYRFLDAPGLPCDLYNSRGWLSCINVLKMVEGYYRKEQPRMDPVVTVNVTSPSPPPEAASEEPAMGTMEEAPADADSSANRDTANAEPSGENPPRDQPEESAPETMVTGTSSTEPPASDQPQDEFVTRVLHVIDECTFLPADSFPKRSSSVTSEWVHVFDHPENPSLPQINQAFHQLISLVYHIHALSSCYFSPAGDGGLSGNVVIPWLRRQPADLLPQMGRLYEFALWEGCQLRSLALSPVDLAKFSFPPQGVHPWTVLTKHAETIGQPPHVVVNATWIASLLYTLRLRLAVIFRRVATGIILPGTVPEPPEGGTEKLSQQLGEILVGHLTPPPSYQEATDTCVWDYYAGIMDHLLALLVDKSFRIQLQPAVLVPFIRAGGVHALLQLREVVWTRYTELLMQTSVDRKVVAPLEKLVEMVLTLLQMLISPHLLPTLPPVRLLGEPESSPATSPEALTVKIRAEALPGLLECWRSPSLKNCSEQILDALIECLAAGLQPHKETPAPSNPAPRPSTPINYLMHLNDLVDMGFPAAAARIALQRNFGSVARAADYLLNNPEVLQSANEEGGEGPRPESSDAAPQEESNDTPAAAMEVDDSRPMDVEPPKSVEQLRTEIESLQKDLRADLVKQVCDLLLHRPDTLFMVKKLLISECQPRESNTVSQLTAHLKNLPCPMHLLPLPLPREETQEKEPSNEPIPIPSEEQNFAVMLRMFSLLIYDTTVQPTVYESGKEVCELLVQYLDQLLQTIARAPPAGLGTTSYRLPVWFSPALLVLKGYLVVNDDVAMSKVLQPREEGAEKATSSTESHATESGQPRGGDRALDMSNIVDTETEETVLPPNLPQYFDETRKLELVRGIVGFLQSTCHLAPGQMQAALDLLVQLTRTFACAMEFVKLDGVNLILTPVGRGIDLFRQQRDLVVVLLRHAIEHPAVLQGTIQRLLDRYSWQSESIFTDADLTTLVSNHDSLVLRDAAAFQRALSHKVESVLRKPADWQSDTTTPEKAPETTSADATNDKSREIALTPAFLTEAYGPDARFAAVSVVKLVIQQLLKLRQQEMDLVQAIPADDFQPDKAETSAGTPETTATENTSMEPSSPERKRLSERPLSPERTRHYHLIAFRCYLLQVLTELMTGFPGLQGEVLDIQRSVSMPLGKDLATTPSKPPKTKSGANLKRHHTLLVKEGDSESGWTQPIRRRSSLIAHIVHDLMVVSKVNDDPQRPCDALIDQQSLAAHTFLGMLCLEQQHPSVSTPTKTEDTSSWDSVTTIARHVTDEIRGVVLDEVADAFKATLDNHLPITKRYSRLWALADFTSRLIIVDRKTRISNMMPVAHLLSALMLERRYASIIVRVLGGLDLNFPHAPTLLARLMLPLVHLTRYYLYHPSTALAPTEGKSGRPVETTDAQATPSRPGRSTHTSRSSQGEIRRLFTDRGGSQGSSNTGPDQNSEEARQEPGERRGATGEGQDQSSVTRNQADEDLDAAEEAEMMIPDFYRNSALFMYDGAMASELDGDSDDLEEDGYDEDGFTDDYDGSGSDISDEEFEEDEDMDMAVLSTSFDDENEDGLSDTSEDMDSEDLMYEAELAMTDNDANDEDASTARSLMAQDDGSDNARDDNAPEMLWDLDDFDVDEDIGSTDESEEDALELGSSLQHRDSGTDRRTVPHGDRRARDASFLVESLTNAFMDAVGGVHHGSQGSSHPFLGDGDDDESLHGHGMEDDMDEEEDDEDDEDDEEEGMDDAVYSLNPFMDPDDPFDNDQGYPSNSLGVHRGRFLGHHHDDNIFTIDAPRLLIRSTRRGPQLGINPWENTSDDQVDTLHLGHFPFSNRSVGPGELAEPHRNGQLSRQSLLTAHPLLLPEGLLDQSGVSDPAAGTSPTPGSVQATTRSPHARLANVGNQYPRTWIPLRFSGHANNGQWVTDLDVFRHRRAQATGQVSVRSSPIPQPYSVLESSHGQPDQGPVASQSHNTALTRYELPTVNSSATPWTEERFVRYVHRFSPWPTATRWRIERCFVHPLADPTRLSGTVRQVVQAMKPLLARLRQERYQAALGTSHGTDAQPRETNGDSPSASPGGRSAATSGTASEPAEERSASPTHAMDLGVESEPTGTDQPAVEPANHAPESPVQQMTTNDNNRMAEDLPRPASTENNIISDEATMGEPAEGEPGSPTPAQNENSVDNGGEEPEATEEASENMVMVGGRLVDISNTGIDPTFLSALPEDIREEVLREHLPPTTPHPSGTPQPQQPSLLPAAETEISQEFLEALPPEIRREILEQQAIDRHFRELNRQGDNAGTQNMPRGPTAGETPVPGGLGRGMPPTFQVTSITDGSGNPLRARDFFATLDIPPRASQRHQFIDIFMPTDGHRRLPHIESSAPFDVIGNSLASHFTTGLGANQPPVHRHMADELLRRRGGPSSWKAQSAQGKDVLTPLLDRRELAVLARLLFLPTHLPDNHALNKLMSLLCEVAKTRGDLIALLLSVLQDNAQTLEDVDRCLGHLVQRGVKTAVTPSKSQSTPKGKSPATFGTPTTTATTSTGTTALPTFPLANVAAHTGPNLPAQCSLLALNAIVNTNHNIPRFFLTENDHLCLCKPTKKGKAREKSIISKYPVVILLSLLDRPHILRNPWLVEKLTFLLASICRPLTAMARRAQRQQEQQASSSAPSAPSVVPMDSSPRPTAQGSTTEPEPSTSTSAAAHKGSAPAATTTVKLPEIPAQYARVVVNPLTMGECSGTTFRYSLSLIQHLSVLDATRKAIVQELVQHTERLAQAVTADLDSLLSALGNCDSMDNLHDGALGEFTAASSNQAKLLRVLKTLDYVYQHKNSRKPPSSNAETSTASRETEEPRASEEAAELATTSVTKANQDEEDLTPLASGLQRYEPLWNKLGVVLKAIQEKSDLTNLATVMLPLVESFMVVASHAIYPRGSQSLGQRSSSTPGTPRGSTVTSAEDFFNSYAESHRKILNSLVRINPSLMSGSFALLVHSPKVLEFDNKRNYFNQKLHRSRTPERDVYGGTLHVNVRRQYVFEDSFSQLQGRSGDEIKYSKLSVKFYDEEGLDAGGVAREWFQVLARQMFNPDYALFKSSAVDRVTYQPNSASGVNPDHLTYFKFVGRIIGKAIFDGRLLDCYFTRSFYKHMLGRSVDYRDVEAIDPEYYKSLVWMLENDITDLLDLTFSIEVDEFGENRVIDLKPGGSEIPVTEENKHEYVKMVCEQKLTEAIREQIDHFLQGFHDIIPRDLVQIFNEQELELLISGLPDIDVDDWKNNTEYHGYTTAAPQIQWFWRSVRSFDQEERAKLLQFVTGTSKVPLQGFSALQGSSGVQRFQIHKDFSSTARLPTAHTCFNQLDLPMYETYEQLRSQLLLAISECSTGFGFV